MSPRDGASHKRGSPVLISNSRYQQLTRDQFFSFSRPQLNFAAAAMDSGDDEASMSLGQSTLDPAEEARQEARAARLRDLIKESFGWKCGTCTTTNDPNDLRCSECRSKRPFNYKVPTELEKLALIATIPPEQLEPPPPKVSSRLGKTERCRYFTAANHKGPHTFSLEV